MTDNLYLNSTLEGQLKIIQEWFLLKKTSQMHGDLWKIFEENLHRKPYSLLAICQSLTEEESLTAAEKKHIIEKAILDISPGYFGYIKLTPFNESLKGFITAYEAKGAD